MAPKAPQKSPLRARRESLGLSPVQVAAAAGVSPQQVANLEVGKHSPNLETARRMATALSTTVDLLFPPPPPKANAFMAPITFLDGDAA